MSATQAAKPYGRATAAVSKRVLQAEVWRWPSPWVSWQKSIESKIHLELAAKALEHMINRLLQLWLGVVLDFQHRHAFA
jgi:hypothetical protein